MSHRKSSALVYRVAASLFRRMLFSSLDLSHRQHTQGVGGRGSLRVWNIWANRANERPFTARFGRAVCVEWVDGAGGNKGLKIAKDQTPVGSRWRCRGRGAKSSIYSDGNSSTVLPPVQNDGSVLLCEESRKAAADGPQHLSSGPAVLVLRFAVSELIGCRSTGLVLRGYRLRKPVSRGANVRPLSSSKRS